MLICPSCHTEYRPGYTTCADCGVALEEDSAPTVPPAQRSDADLLWTWVVVGGIVGTVVGAVAYVPLVNPFGMFVKPAGFPLERLDLATIAAVAGIVFQIGSLPGALGGFIMGQLALRVRSFDVTVIGAPVVGGLLGALFGPVGIISGAVTGALTAGIVLHLAKSTTA